MKALFNGGTSNSSSTCVRLDFPFFLRDGKSAHFMNTDNLRFEKQGKNNI